MFVGDRIEGTRVLHLDTVRGHPVQDEDQWHGSRSIMAVRNVQPVGMPVAEILERQVVVACRQHVLRAIRVRCCGRVVARIIGLARGGSRVLLARARLERELSAAAGEREHDGTCTGPWGR
jgi:hypothetical protein